MSAPYDYKVLIDDPAPETPCSCSDCIWQGPYSELLEIGDCSLTPGDPSPAGRCPECETLAYILKANDAPQTRAQCSPQPASGHGIYVDVVNALLAARDKDAQSFSLQTAMTTLLKLGLDQGTDLEVLHDHGEKYPDAAESVEVDDDLEVDGKPLFSRADEGTWVSAWVFVRDPETAEDEGEA